MASSCDNKSSLPMITNEAAPGSCAYPAPLAKYEEVVDDSFLFMSTLEKLHASLGTKFMIPIIGGSELDLHRLFVEVTSRGGMAKVRRGYSSYYFGLHFDVVKLSCTSNAYDWLTGIRQFFQLIKPVRDKQIISERRWKDVTSAFNFPATATNASFVLRKHYASLLYHYEQIYYFKAREWNPASSDGIQYLTTVPVPAPKMQFSQPPSEIQPSVFQQPNVNTAMAASSAGSPVIGVIDGKFEGGYLVTVTIGSEKLKGVLYEATQNKIGSEKLKGVLYEVPINPVFPAPYGNASANNSNASASLGVKRRRRRKKSEMKRRDPNHPKPNRSGYNFFFAEQHARLKLLNQGKDREISRMIGELWNKLNESEKVVYQEKAVKDKERYRVEMEDYRLKLKMGQVIRDAVPLQQRQPESYTEMLDADMKLDAAEEDSHQTLEESSSGGSDYEEDNAMEKDFEMDGLPVVGEGAESSCLGSEEKLSKGDL